MSFFARIRLDVKRERVEISAEETALQQGHTDLNKPG